MTTKFFRILVDRLSIQKCRWLSNSSRLRWPQNSLKILQGFWSDIFLIIRWRRNSYQILQGLGSEFWYPVLESNNSDQYQILQELGDHGILGFWSKFFSRFRWPQNSSRNFNGHGILQGFWSELFLKIRWPQNSGSQP